MAFPKPLEVLSEGAEEADGGDLVIDLSGTGGSKEVCKLIACEFCPRTFVQQSNYRTHLKVHGLGKQLFICLECGKDFQYKNSFLIHRATHRLNGQVSADVPDLHSCGFCGRQFVYRHDLQRHENIHTRKKLFTCSACSRSFVHLTSLKVHQRVTHNLYSNSSSPPQPQLPPTPQPQGPAAHQSAALLPDIKTYECRFCQIRMKDLSNMKVHEQLHTGIRPFRCDRCSKKFARKSDLKEHELVHQDHHSFRCSICHKSFKSRKGWAKHKRNTHQDLIHSLLDVQIMEKMN